MSAELKKRGRPKKVVDEVVILAEKTPDPASPRSAKRVSKPTTTNTTSLKSGGSRKEGLGKKLDSKTTSAVARKGTVLKSTPATKAEEPPPPVLHAIAIEETKILKELAEVKKSKESRPKTKLSKTTLPNAAEVLLPPSPQPQEALHLVPTHTLAMGLPIPSFQSKSYTIPLRTPPHLLPWLPNPALLSQTAHLSTKTKHPSQKVLSLKEANQGLINELSTGTGTGRPRPAPESGRRMPKYAKYRVMGVYAGLPVVIMTSYWLYERCKSLS